MKCIGAFSSRVWVQGGSDASTLSAIRSKEAIHSLVDEMNKQGDGFKFTKDLVLKAGLMLSDIGSVVSKSRISTKRIWQSLRPIDRAFMEPC